MSYIYTNIRLYSWHGREDIHRRGPRNPVRHLRRSGVFVFFDLYNISKHAFKSTAHLSKMIDRCAFYIFVLHGFYMDLITDFTPLM